MSIKTLAVLAMAATISVPCFAQDAAAKPKAKKRKKAQQVVPARDKDGWMSMFNGRSLAGWTQKNGWATYKVQPAEGDNPAAIVGTTAKGSPNSFLCSVRSYGDFELEFEVNVHDRLNSGVQIRSQTKRGQQFSIFNTGRVNGPQVEIEASGEKGAESGYIYGEATGGGWMTPDAKRTPHKHFKDGEWNKYRILAKGANIKVWVNGEMISDLTDEEKFQTYPKGFIGLQVHGIGQNPGPWSVAWRNLRIREFKSPKAKKQEK